MQHLITQLTNKRETIKSHPATIGFDGFIDTIVKLIKHKDSAGKPVNYFNSAADWANHILGKKGANFSIELTQCSIKAGGNTPNMANAMAKLGLTVNCAGALGYPVIDPIFSQLPATCRLYSFATPGTCQAIEFGEGKMMLANMDELNKVDWNILKLRIPVNKLIEIFDAASIIGLLNWGEMVAATGFWKGLLQDVLPFCRTNMNKLFFVDLSDCTGRTKDETLAALELLKHFSSYGKLILSLNHNESIFIHTLLSGTVPDNIDTKTLGEEIFLHLEPGTLLLHNHSGAVAFRKNDFAQKDSFFIEAPKLLTGAGDNFNAGFCFAQLMELGLEDSLTIAHLVAACYIKNGESPDWNALINALETV